jgi:hypothetical protein
MFNKKVVQKALKQTREFDPVCRLTPGITEDCSSSMISRLIYDVFGGKILKICKKKGWHFYNHIDGEPVDFTVSETDNFSPEKNLGEQSATPEETRNYFAQEDYLTFYMRFINSFEEIIGLKKYRRGEIA